VKILWLNANLLLPLDKGGKLRTWHVMRHLAARHDITYLSFTDPSAEPAYRDGMREVCTRLETIPRTDAPKGTLRFYADAARYLLDPVPYGVAKYRSTVFAERLDALLRTESFDAVICDFLVPVVNMPERLPCPGILFTHNVEAEIWRRHAEHADNPVARFLLGQQWRRMLRFEGEALRRFDLVLAVSEADQQALERLYPASLREPARIIQTGVDTTYFTPVSSQAPRADSESPQLVFTGSMDWLPNEDGMIHFADEILPRIRAAIPGVTLSIVGRAPTPAVRRLAERPGIDVTGRVDDVRPHVAAGTVYVVPLRIGGGTRLKIFEAMSMGKAVVSTSIGAEGLPVTDGRDVILADDPQSFADAVVNLIRDTGARARIEAAARRLVVERYEWSAVAEDFEAALAHVCRTTRSAAPVTGRRTANCDLESRGAREGKPLVGSI
jgi:sugar transferase (PEP-CTERM/EpsH1 system associated)